MSKASEAWENLERSVARLEKAARRRSGSGEWRPSPSHLEGLDRIGKLIHKLEAWRKSV